MKDNVAPPPAVPSRYSPGIATRVLWLIIAFVMLAEVAIYIPSIANFRNNWLETRLSAAYIAALVLQAAPADMVPEQLKRDLLENVGARMIVLKTRDSRRMLAVNDMPPEIDEIADLRNFSAWESIMAAFRTLSAPAGRIIDVKSTAPMGAEYIEVAMDEAPLKAAMRRYSVNILLLSLLISGLVASLAALALHLMVLRPVRRLTGNVVAFAADPENTARIIVPSGRTHEIGAAENALAGMQVILARELTQKKHLAALGLAVAKINHDLRNMLSSAQLISDRLAGVNDPLVMRLAPKLVATLDRAIRFCQTTLVYGRSADEPPKLASTALAMLADEAIETAIAPAQRIIRVENNVPRDLTIQCDREQIFRVLLNLARNAVDALEAAGAGSGENPALAISAQRRDDGIVILVADNGPGLPHGARKRLFVAFSGSARPGGTGLGLAIAADLVRGHGGTLRLLDNAPADRWPGAVFEILLPQRSDVPKS